MNTTRRISAGLFLLAAASACSLDTGPGRELHVADLTGAKMVPPVEVLRDGNPSTASVLFSIQSERIVYEIHIFNVETATSATLHIGGPTENNAAVATLFSSSAGFSGTTTVVLGDELTASELLGGASYASVLNAIRSGNAYVILYTADFPSGALRGQTVRLGGTS